MSHKMFRHLHGLLVCRAPDRNILILRSVSGHVGEKGQRNKEKGWKKKRVRTNSIARVYSFAFLKLPQLRTS